MSPHTHWKLTFTESNTGPVMLDEVELMFDGWLTGLVPASVAASSTDTAQGFSPSGLFDGQTTAGSQWSHGWHSDGNVPQWLQFNFDTPVEIDAVRLQQRHDLDDINFPTAMNLAHSDDGVVWTVLWAISGLPTTRPKGAKACYGAGGYFDLQPKVTIAHKPWSINNSPPLLYPGVRVNGVRARVGDHGGTHRIAGNTSIFGTPLTPVSRKVRLFDLQSGQLVAETVSAADGTYVFNNISRGRYFVVGHDHTEFYNAVIQDRIDAEPTP